MESFMIKALKRLRKEIPRRFKDLRSLCDQLLASYTQEEKDNDADFVGRHGKEYLDMLIATCESSQPRMMEIALDAIHYMIEHGYLKSSAQQMVPLHLSSSSSSTQPPPLHHHNPSQFVLLDKAKMTQLIETVCKGSDEFDEGVHLQVINALLTAITSTYCEVHDANLLLAMRACFHIHLMSKNPAIKVAAKAALTQIVSIINQRMEVQETQHPQTELGENKEGRGSSLTREESKLLPVVLEETAALEKSDESEVEVNGDEEKETLKVTTSDIELVNGGQEVGSQVLEASSEKEREAAEKEVGGSLTADDSVLPSSAEKLTVISEGSDDLKSALLEEKEGQPGDGSKEATQEGEIDLGSQDLRISTGSISVVDGSGGSVETFPSVYHRDAYLLFRALCKLSMKGISDESQVAYSDNLVLQNKILSLELLYYLLKNCGPAFRTGEKFIHAIRSFLCVSLLNNCTSHVTQVTGLSLQIFTLLMQNFKEHLKSEVEVFVSTIFLRILESENSTYEHKVRVLEVFHTICRDPSTQIEIFINYDCDLGAINLFSRIVAAFAKLAKVGGHNNRAAATMEFMSNSNKRFAAEDLQIRSMGLEGLLLVLRSLVMGAGFNTNVNVSGSKAAGAGGEEVEEKEPTSELSTPSAALPGGNNTLQTKQESEAGVASGRPAPAPMMRMASSEGNAIPSGSSALSPTSASVAAANGGFGNADNGTNASMVDVFDKKLKIQEEIDTGIVKFNLSPMKGIKYLVSLGHLRLDPKDVAVFLREHEDKLDKTMVGDLLGREREYENGFCYKVLHEYVQNMDFTSMSFDIAMRSFLSGFRLPGEAQKIDRIMEKFAERYYLQHQDEFASADMAFILAFSTIMLQTNLHNPAIRDDKRMTKEQFIKQNKGISSDGELSDELLSNIYDRIAAQPISITQEGSKKGKKDENSNGSFIVFQSISDRRKKDAFTHERKEMVKAGEAMIRQMKKRTSVFLHNHSVKDEIYAYIKAMYEIVWPPMLAVLSQVLETFDDPTLVKQCLQGFQLSIVLACRMEFTVARNTYINAMSKFTTLDSVREMKVKNVQCIKLLLKIALTEGEFLEESWTQILQNISQLARLLLLATGLHSDDLFFNDMGSNLSSEHGSSGGRQPFLSRRGSSMSMSGGSGRHGADSRGAEGMLAGVGLTDPFTKLFLGPSKAETTRLVEETNSEILCRDIDPSLIDKIFSSSTILSGSGIYHFVSSLCEVSMSEISVSGNMNSIRGRESGGFDAASPRVFSLQKLVEVADGNMNIRSRMDWAKIWSLLANHFSNVGVSDNQALAMFAIDSLKQLSIKFLQKDELSNFNFQRIFLKPFEKIMARSSSVETKDLILRCLHIMIKSCASNIHSGWRSIFGIFDVAAGQDNLELAKLAFDITEQLINEEFDLLTNDFVELMNCLVAFASGPHTALSLRALSYLTYCADHLAKNSLPGGLTESLSDVNRGQSSQHHSKFQINGDDSVFRLWWPLLLGLSTRVGDVRLQIRLKALDCLQTILKKHGLLFSPQAWSVIFKGVLFPMVDSAKMDNTIQPHSIWPSDPLQPSHDKHSWIGTMALTVLSSCVELYMQFKESGRTRGLLGDLLAMLSDCILQDVESLGRIGVKVLRDLIVSLDNHGGLDNEARSVAVDRLRHSGLSSSGNERLAVGGEGMLLLREEEVGLLVSQTNSCLLGNLLLDFQEAGSISPQHYVSCPMAVKMLLSDCPLSKRRKERGQVVGSHRNPLSQQAAASIGRVVTTIFGLGTILEVKDADDIGEERVHIQLTWGAHLYSMGGFTMHHPALEERALNEMLGRSNSDSNLRVSSASQQGKERSPSISSANRGSSRQEGKDRSSSVSGPSRGSVNNKSPALGSKQGQALSREEESNWREFSSAAMTCLVLTLELVQVHRLLLCKYHHSLSLSHLERSLRSLESSYWHAFSFNENLSLRLKLQQRGFMNRNGNAARALRTLPNLLEQEVKSLEGVLEAAFTIYLYHHGGAASSANLEQGVHQTKSDQFFPQRSREETLAFVKPWLQRCSSLVLSRYLSFEEGSNDWSSSDGEASEDEADGKTGAGGGAGPKGRGGERESMVGEEKDARRRKSSTAAQLENALASKKSPSSGVLRDQQFLRAQHTAYLGPVRLILERVTNFDGSAFQEHCHWLVPLLSRMIICENASVRSLVRQIFQQFVDPVFMLGQSSSSGFASYRQGQR